MDSFYRHRYSICLVIAMMIHLIFFVIIPKTEKSKNVNPSKNISTQIFLSSKQIQTKKEIPKPNPIQEIISSESKKKIKKREEKPKPKNKNSEPPTIKREESSVSQSIDHKKLEKYINKVIYLVNRHKKYPRISELNREEGLVGIEIRLNREGELLGYQVEKKSGYIRLDQGAIKAIESIRKYPKIYPDYPHEEIRLKIPINFQI